MEYARLHPALAIAAFCFGLIVAFLHPGEGGGLLGALDNKLLDLRFQWRGERHAPETIAILAIDDKTIGELGRFPVPRREIAGAIEQVLASGAAAVAVDLLLLEREAPHDGNVLSAGDRRFLEMLRATDRVILAAVAAAGAGAPASPDILEIARANAFAIVARDPAISPDHASMQGLLAPIEPFAVAAPVALVNVGTEDDGTLRRLPLAIEVTEGTFMPALPLEAVRRKLAIDRQGMRLSLGVGIELGRQIVPTDYAASIAIDFLGPRGAIPTYSLIDVAKGRIAKQALAGRMVFVGATALGFGDVFKSPFAPDLPGVEVLASVAENIEQGRILRRDSLSWSLDMGLGAVFALLAFLAANARALPVSGLLYVLLWPAAGAALQYLFQARLFWLDGAAMVLTLTATGLCVFGARLRLQRRVAAKLRQQRDHLASYQSPLLREWLAGPEAPDRSGRMQLATILFVDLSGFTRRAQSMGPAATSSFLRDLHRLFERAALAHEGVIENFAGDGAMLIFGLPRARPTDAPRALLCVRDMLRDVEHWSGELASAGGEPLALRAGLHSGPVMVARLGGDRQAHVTASGDTVNVASRLLDIAKREAAPIVATADFAAAVRAAGRADLLEASRALSGQSLRGRAGDMDLLLLG